MYFRLLTLALTGLSIVLISCSTNTSSPTSEQDATSEISTSTAVLDFGSIDTVKTFDITIPTNRQITWKMRKTRAWLSISAEQGTQTTTITVTVNRKLLVDALSSDTIVVSATRPMVQTYTMPRDGDGWDVLSTKSVAVNVTKNLQTLLTAIESSVGNGAKLPPTIDTTASLLGAFMINTAGVGGLKSAVAEFNAAGTVGADAGDLTLLAKAAGNKDKRGPIPFRKQQISYTSSSNGATYTGVVYLPEPPPLGIPWTIDFDNATYDVFSLTGTGSIPTFKDSLLSTLDAQLASPPTTVTRTNDLTLSWSPTASSDDQVFAVIVAQSDTTIRVVSAVADDNAGSLVIPATKLGKLATGQASIWFARFRYAVHSMSGNKIGILSQSQTQYSVTLN